MLKKVNSKISAHLSHYEKYLNVNVSGNKTSNLLSTQTDYLRRAYLNHDFYPTDLKVILVNIWNQFSHVYSSLC